MELNRAAGENRWGMHLRVEGKQMMHLHVVLTLPFVNTYSDVLRRMQARTTVRRTIISGI
jgi:hypothetical protein